MFSEKAFARLRLFAAVVAMAIVAVATFVSFPQDAWAEDLPGYYMGYKDSPQGKDGDAIYPDGQGRINPGFRWVPADRDNGIPAHYEIYKAVNNPELGATHEDVIGWWYFAYYSHQYNFEDYLIQLDDDLDFSEYEFERNGGDRRQLAVGTEDVPFKGTFDGKSHAISNVDNHRDGLWIETDCGFFGCVQEAVVKNISFKDCYVGASYRGGLVCGYAQDTLFMNVTATNCTTSVIPPNNVLNLITNAGMSGGMIVGEANGCTLYNCEMEGGRVINNATSGVGALGGQPLYLGGLVGWCNDTVIEYSRVTDIENEDGTYTQAKIENKYGTAVSVANYSELFTGGIVGGMKAEDSGSKIVDCYCTADVYSEAAIYFAVGLGLGVTRGYTGGMVGIVQEGAKDDNDAAHNLIQRVSFAGNLHSYNYNIILLGIPAIEHDKYMGGITGRGGGNATIDQAYYMRYRNSAQGENSIWGSTTDEDIYDYKTTYNGGVSGGSNFGARDDDYTDREFWEGCDFDFAGGKLRDLGYDFTAQVQDSEWKSSHYNKWVMDYDRGMPVHGGSIKATMDYPKSGTVAIGTTSLSANADFIPEEDRDWKTSNPYDFAVQGYEEGDESIEITYDLNKQAPDGSSWASDSQNEGYRFMGWYRSRGVRVNDIAENHSLFTTRNSMLNAEDDPVISDARKVEGNNDYGQDSYTLKVNRPATDETEDPKDYHDNDLYVAYAQAQALLHNTAGGLVAPGTGEADANKDNDWYDYGQTLTLPSKVAGDESVVSGGGSLVGWTTRANTEGGSSGAYTNATSSTINRLRNDGVFFEPGESFTVTEPTNLYPVYASLGSNVTVIFEGHDQDPSNEGADGTYDDASKRDGFGQAFVRTDTTDGETRYYVTIDDMTEWGGNDGAVQNDNQITSTISPISESYNATDTAINDSALVRFLGWYETVTDGENTFEVRVSDQPTFYLDDVDLTQEHTYIAKFEYCVRYWWDAETAASAGAVPYSTDWVRYGEERYDPSIDGEGEHTFNRWLTGGSVSNGEALNPYDSQENQKQGNQDSSAIMAITYPFSFHGDWNRSGSGANVEVNTDFPTGPGFTLDFGGGYSDDLIVDMPNGNEGGYNFHLWSGENDQWINPWKSASTDLRWNAGNHYVDGERLYWFEARVTADVTFHGADDGKSVVVERQYEDNALNPNPVGERTYYYLLNADDQVEIGGEAQRVTITASPTDDSMAREGYIFLGWIDKNAISEDEFNYIFNGEQIAGTDVKLVKNVTRAKPYLMDGTEVVRHPMDLYPVYTTFFVETDTNVNPDNVSSVDIDTYNIPNDPTITDGKINDTETPQVSLDYNEENGPLPEHASPANITYAGIEEGDLGNAEAKIVVTANKDTKVLKDESTSEVYQLQSISVMIGDDVVETLTPDDGSGSVTYTIEAGVDYTFRANYSPVPVQVIYHLDNDGGDDDTGMHTVSVGDLLPATTKTPTFSELDKAFHVGWVVGDESGSITEWNDQLDLAEPGVDTVTGTTHLWPVYRKGDVTVKSNIDNELANADEVRYTEVRGDSLYLVAKDVEGYRFDGWYTGYTDEENRGTQLTSAHEHSLTGDARFDGTTYTAVYTNMGDIPQVQYHDTQGNVIYTAYAEGKNKDRTFLQKMTYQKPVFDENGNPVYEDDGVTQKTVTVTEKVIIDLDAFSMINERLSAANSAEGAQDYEEFVTWQWVDTAGGTPERWGKNDDENNFINETVASNVDAENTDDHVMNLYPVTIKLKATAPSDDSADGTNYTGGLRVAELNRNGSDKLTSAHVTLLSNYTKPWLKVNLTEYAYNEGEGGTGASSVATPQADVKVNLYAPNSSTSAPLSTATTVSEGTTDHDVQLQAGDALFIFNGRLVINKSADEATDGQVFTFKVTDSGNNTRLVPVTVQAVKGADGNVTGYSGSSRLILPYGTYTVAEDDWAWRYTNSISSGDDEGSDGSVTVDVQYAGVAPDGSPAATVVDCENKLANDDWFSDEASKRNEFTEGAGE